MLTTLRIENFAIVKQLELDFSSGMIAFTGETGAGKSIMIDALMLALGGRTDASVIRSGEEKCDITACFHFENHSEPAHWLAEREAGKRLLTPMVIEAVVALEEALKDILYIPDEKEISQMNNEAQSVESTQGE